MNPKAVKFSVTVSNSIYEGLLAAAGRAGIELNTFAQRILTQAIMDEGLIAEDEEASLRNEWLVVDQAREIAKRLCRNGRFSAHINRDTLKECSKIPGWLDAYSACINGNPYQTGNKTKTELNRKLGRNIREAIGGVVVKDEKGNPIKENVVGEFFQKYTLMESFDPATL